MITQRLDPVMKNQKPEMIVGLTVTIALLILIFGLIWGKGMNLFSNRSFLRARFHHVAGLESGDPVMIRGIEKGEVNKVELHGDHVEVIFWIDAAVPLYSDIAVVIESRELMGGKQISLFPGTSGKPLDTSAVLTGIVQGDVLAMMAKAENMIIKMDSLFYTINQVVDPEHVHQVLVNLETMTTDLGEMIHASKPRFQTAVARMDTISRRLNDDLPWHHMKRMLVTLDSTSGLLHQFSIRMQNRESTLGRMLEDDMLYDQVLHTSIRLDSLLQDIRENPKRYLHVSLF